ncbi:MAG: DUF721 domain-containing protein [Deltaproteobacteria bacterium]|nr:DUF721 domain-containing protein [Deltaproteobacteria bacterium]
MRERIKKQRPVSIGEVISSVLENLDIPPETVLKGKALNAWKAVAGEAATHSEAIRFQGKTIVVAISGSGWMTELSMRKVELLRRLEREVGENIVTDIRFQMDRKQTRGPDHI